MAEYYLTVPLQDEDIAKLEIGDLVYFSGAAWTCRSRLQKYVFDEGHKLPFSTDDKNLLIHVGPVVVSENGGWRLVSFMPTSSIRFEKWGTSSIETFGLKAIVGKTTMGEETGKAMVKNTCVHCTPIGVPVQMYLEKIKVKDVYWFEELGSIEAAWQLELNELGPFLVDMDTKGRNHFDKLDKVIDENRKKVYEKLGIPEDFQYTKLY
jgi:tartrate/fumarate subfamily iron-sulfur-dependent hydro-lyase beta chain